MIISVADIKTLLKISDNSLDSILNLEVPMVQESILNFLRNKFKTVLYLSSKTLSFSSHSITSSSDNFITSGLINGNYCIEGSNFNDSFVTVTNVAASTLTVTETLITESNDNNISLSFVKFPLDLGFILSQMVSFNLNQKYGVKSESFSRYSVSYGADDGKYIAGYPNSLVSGLLKYRMVYNDY